MIARIFDQSQTPWGLKYRSSNWFIVLTVTCAVFTDIFLYGVIVPIIPFALQERANVAEDRVQYWISVLLAIYGVGLVVFSPICGWFSDRISARRWPLLLGLIALLGATVMLNVATSIPVFIVGRLLQGISAAVVWVVGLALLADTVPRKSLGQYIGYVSLGMTLGFMLGPLLGGVLFKKAGYNGVWALCYAFIGLDFVFRIVLIEKKDAKKWNVAEDSQGDDGQAERPPLEGEAEEEEEATEETPDEPAVQPGQKTQLQKLTSRLPPVITLLASRRLLAALFASIVEASLVASFDSVLPLFVNEIFGWESLQSGILYLTIVIPTLASPLIGYFADVYGGRLFSFAGFLLACPFFVLLRLVDHNSLSQKALLVALLVLIGCAMTLVFPPVMAEITHVVIAKEESSRKESTGTGTGTGTLKEKGGAYAQAYALFNVAFALGTLVGPLWGGLIKQQYGWNTMSWTLGLLAGVTAVPCLWWVDGSLRRMDRGVFSRRDQ